MSSRTGSQVNPRKALSAPRLVILLILLAVLAVIAVPLNARFAASSQMRRHIQDGIKFYQNGDTDKAVAEWRTALREDPTRPEPYRLLSEALITRGMPEEAIPLLERLQKIAPQMEHLYCQLAEARALTDEGAVGVAAAKTAVEKEPECARAHALYGIQMGNQSNHVAAISELTRATILDPKNEKIALSLAQAQLNSADLEGAEKTVRQVLALKQDDAKAYYLLGWSFARRTLTPQNVEQAMSAFKKAYQLDPTLEDVPAELGRMSILSQDFEGAKGYLEKAWGSNPQSEDIAFNLAKAYRSLGDTKNAARMNAEFKRISDRKTRVDALHKRLSINAKDFDAAIELASIETSAQNWAEAGPLLEALLKARPNDARIREIAARFYRGIGDTKTSESFEQPTAAPTGAGSVAK